MITSQRLLISAISGVAAIMLLLNLIQAQERAPDPTSAERSPVKPKPALSPEQVVLIQLNAMASNDIPTKDAGIALVYNFASPANRIQTGPLPRFKRMIHDGYQVMLNHTNAQLGTLQHEDSHAAVNVFLVASDGRRVGFRFFLSKQTEGDHRGCWMTDAVIPIEAEII